MGSNARRPHSAFTDKSIRIWLAVAVLVLTLQLASNLLGVQSLVTVSAADYPMPSSDAGSLAFQLPWPSGTHSISGYTAGCGDHGGSLGGTPSQYYALDFHFSRGQEISSIGPGTVTTGSAYTVGAPNFGRYVIVHHTDTSGNSNGYASLYTHLNSQNVADLPIVNGKPTVARGQKIGTAGDDGIPPISGQDNVHLHFVVFQNIAATDDAPWNQDVTHAYAPVLSGYHNFWLKGQSVLGAGCGTFVGSEAYAAVVLPGGWYVGPTPSDGTTVGSGQRLAIQIHAYDYTNSGLDYVNITSLDSGSTYWCIREVHCRIVGSRQGGSRCRDA